jgi:hypothetical protein
MDESTISQQQSEPPLEEARISRDHLKEDIQNAVEPQDTRDSVDDNDGDGSPSQDTTSKPSTRLVKFQLFETKAVDTHRFASLIPAILHPRLEPERNAQSNPQN